MFKKVLSCSIGMATLSFCSMQENKSVPTARHAIAILYPDNSNVRGIASFSQDSILQPTKIAFSVKGLTPNAKHGVHIHEFGDLTEGCKTAGPHYNPENTTHGGPFEKIRHVGDLGNLPADPFGNSFICFTDRKVSLFGDFSVIGRSVVVHANEDDLGKKGDEQSLKTGNSGQRVACGTIGLAKEFKTTPSTQFD